MQNEKDEMPFPRVGEQPLSETAELPQRPTGTVPPTAPEKKPLINASSLARMAGNIASGYVATYNGVRDVEHVASVSVKLARAIAAEIERTEPVR